MMKHYIGIDPGMTGAYAVLNENGGFEDLRDYPGDTALLVYKLMDSPLFYIPNPASSPRIRAAIEKVSVMPKQGIVSAFKFGTNYGIWLGLLGFKEIPIVIVSPQEWHKGLNYPARKKGETTNQHKKRIKEHSLITARRLFPKQIELLKRKKDHNRAEALLIAHWLWNKYKER